MITGLGLGLEHAVLEPIPVMMMMMKLIEAPIPNWGSTICFSYSMVHGQVVQVQFLFPVFVFMWGSVCCVEFYISVIFDDRQQSAGDRVVDH